MVVYEANSKLTWNYHIVPMIDRYTQITAYSRYFAVRKIGMLVASKNI